MSGECDKCGQHCLECKCEDKLRRLLFRELQFELEIYLLLNKASHNVLNASGDFLFGASVLNPIHEAMRAMREEVGRYIIGKMRTEP